MVSSINDPGKDSIDQFNRDAVVEGMDDGWMVLDPENNIVDINPAAERMAGLARDKVIGQPIGFRPERSAQSRAYIQRQSGPGGKKKR